MVVAKKIGTVAVSAQTGALSYGTAASASYTVSVNRIGSNGALDADLSITTALPLGTSASFSPTSVHWGNGDTTAKTSTLTLTTTSATPAGANSFTVQAANASGIVGDSSTTNGTLTVDPKALTMTGLSVPVSKVYNGTTAAVVSGSPGLLQAAEPKGTGTSSDGKPYTGDTVSLTGTATGTYNSKDVSTATTVTFGGLSLTGASAANYTLTIQAPAAATITAKALTFSGLSVPASKVYDGTTAAVVSGTPALQAAEAPGAGTTADGKPYTGDTVSLTGIAAGTYNTQNVSTATNVTFGGVSLAGAASVNYTLTNHPSASATITPATLTYTADPKSRAYGAANPAFTGTVSGFIGSETQASATTGTLAFSSAATQTSGVGSYSINGSGLTANSGNYTFAQAAANATALTINKADATVVVTPYTVTYDGQPHTATVTSITGVNGETGATVGTVDVSNTTHTAAGTYAADSWSFTGAANYNDIASTTITDTINKADATVVVTPYTVTYDGQPHTATVTSITGVNGETGATVGTVDVSNTTHTAAGTYAPTPGASRATANYNDIAARRSPTRSTRRTRRSW